MPEALRRSVSRLCVGEVKKSFLRVTFREKEGAFTCSAKWLTRGNGEKGREN